MAQIHDWILGDIMLLKQCDDVLFQSCDVSEDMVLVSFDLAFGFYAQASEERIHNPEPITLVYQNSEQLNQPSIRATRSGFPRDLPHLNPVASGSSPSICLWRKGGTQTLYRQRGILEVIRILQLWLEDASLELLDKDGWEPSPRDSLVSFYCDVRRLQEILVEPKNADSVFSIKGFGLFFELSGNYLFGYSACGRELNERKLNPKRKVKKADQLTQSLVLKDKEISNLKVVVASPPLDFIDQSRNADEILNLDDLRNYANYKSLSDIVDVIQQELSASKDERGVIVLVVHRRPLSLIADIHGLSEEPEERKIEIVPFFVHRRRESVRVHFLSLRSDISAKELSDISDYDVPQGKIGVVGCGAVNLP